MAKRFLPNQRDKIKEHFKEHVYYKLCREVYDVFLNHTPSIIMSAEDLFVDASNVLDNILITGDADAEVCKKLWSDTMRTYRDLDGSKVGIAESQAEVAMLIYAVMFGLESVCASHYRGKLQRTLHSSIHRMWDKEKKNCSEVEKELKLCINKFTNDMLVWMKEYLYSKDSLNKQIVQILQNKRKNTSNKKKSDDFHPTIKYICNANEKAQRVDIVMKLLKHWRDINEPRNADDFQDFFSGDDLNLNITWSGESNLLYFLVKTLLEQKFVEKQVHGSATAIAKNVLGSIPNSNKERHTTKNQKKIDIIVYALNPSYPILELTRPEDVATGYNDDYIAEQVAKMGDMHIDKDLKKEYD